MVYGMVWYVMYGCLPALSIPEHSIVAALVLAQDGNETTNYRLDQSNLSVGMSLINVGTAKLAG